MTYNAPRVITRLLLILLPFSALAQSDSTVTDKGVRFESGISWSAVRAKAKSENKYIFMDCYTTWCGPCKYMSKTIFPQQVTGDYFNSRFVSIAVQLDTTAKDDGETRKWYADAHAIAEKYGVRAYPTYLVFTPDGQVVHRLVGSRINAAAFITDMSGSFDSTRQYYTLLHQYEGGRRDSAFLHALAMQCLFVYDFDHLKPVIFDYLATQPNPYTKNNLILMVRATDMSTDKYFPFLIDHAAAVDSVMGPGQAGAVVRGIFIKEGLHQAAAGGSPDWKAIRARIAARMPADADELTARIKVNFYRNRKDWPNFETAMVAYMKAFGAKMDDNDLNTIAWAAFQNCSDMTCVAGILDWSRQLKASGNPAFMDTYANILYKLGKKDDAIALEEKAINLSPDADKADMQATLDKMKKGEKTWD